MERYMDKSGSTEGPANADLTPAEVMAKSFGDRYEFSQTRASSGDLKWIQDFAALGGFGEAMEYAGPALIDACYSGHTELAHWLHAKGARVSDKGIRQIMLFQLQRNSKLSHLAPLFNASAEDMPGRSEKHIDSGDSTQQPSKLSNASNPVPISELMAGSADVAAYDSDGRTALQIAIILGDASRARDLIARGASLLVKNNRGDNAVTCAATSSSMDLMEVIYDSGKLTGKEIIDALPDSRYSNAREYIAERESRKKETSRLSKYFADAFKLEDNDIFHPTDQQTIKDALANLNFSFDAASYLGMCYYFMDRGYYPDVAGIARRMITKKTPSEAIDAVTNYWAYASNSVALGILDMMRNVFRAAAVNLVLWQSEADLNKVLEGLTAKDLSKNESDGEEILRDLRSSIEDVRAIHSHADHPGRSLLALAVLKNRPNLISQLIEFGANPNQLDGTGNRPLHVAATLGNKLLVKQLLRKGANKELRNQSNLLAFDVAARHNSRKLKALLSPR